MLCIIKKSVWDRSWINYEFLHKSTKKCHRWFRNQVARCWNVWRFFCFALMFIVYLKTMIILRHNDIELIGGYFCCCLHTWNSFDVRHHFRVWPKAIIIIHSFTPIYSIRCPTLARSIANISLHIHILLSEWVALP